MWSRAERSSFDAMFDRMLAIENRIGMSLPRVASTEARMAHVQRRLDKFESRLDLELKRRRLVQEEEEAAMSCEDASDLGDRVSQILSPAPGSAASIASASAQATSPAAPPSTAPLPPAAEPDILSQAMALGW